MGVFEAFFQSEISEDGLFSLKSPNLRSHSRKRCGSDLCDWGDQQREETGAVGASTN